MIEDTWESSERPAHPSPFCGGQGGDPKRSLGLGRVFRLRFPGQGTVPWAGGRGRDEAATQARGGTAGLSLRWSCRRFGRALEETATPQPTGGARRYGRA
jgi:hypothetical protein